MYPKQSILLLSCILLLQLVYPQQKILAFYTARQDLAHISFVHEANNWFAKKAKANGIGYDSTNDWSELNERVLRQYDLILFLDTRPEEVSQRNAFEKYIKDGGAWMGFHFSAFALTPSAYEQNWNWYHDLFLGSGQYQSNTWRPAAAMLRVEATRHPAVKNLPPIFRSAPNEWYRWEKDLRQNPDIEILLAIDSSSFPLGTGPKPQEIWHSGYYPVAWTNKKYRMLYMNMGHNDMDYGGTNASLSSSFSSEEQNRFIWNAVIWLLQKRKP